MGNKIRVCRSVQGLVSAIEDGVRAELCVYSIHFGEIYGEYRNVVHLNLGGNRFSQVSESTWAQIKDHVRQIK